MSLTKKACIRFNLFLLLSFFVLDKCYCSDYRFLQIGVSQGLSQGSIFAITQDFQGFMWIGTRDGLNKFDARKIKIYRNDIHDKNSLSSSHIHSILEDSQRRLWVGTMRGLNLYDRRLDRFQPIKWTGLAKGEIEPVVYHLSEDSKNNIYAATSSGLFRLHTNEENNATVVFTKVQIRHVGLPRLSDDIHYLYEDISGRIWLCTNEAVVLLRKNTARDQRFIVEKVILEQSLGENQVPITFRSMYEISPQLFWIATKGGGIKVFNQKTGEISSLRNNKNIRGSLPSDDVRTFFRDRQGRLWVGTFNGLALFKNNQFITYQRGNTVNSLSDNSIRPIFQDKRGSIWIGTYYGGINIFDDDIPEFQNFSQQKNNDGLSFNVVSSFVEMKNGFLMIGTEGGGINYFNRNRQSFAVIKHQEGNLDGLSHNNVKALCIDSDGDLWVGTYDGGLNLKRKGQDKFEHFLSSGIKPPLTHNSVYALKEDKLGNIWAGTFGGGLQCATKTAGNVTFKTYNRENGKLSSDHIRTIYEDTKGNIWVGAQQGLFLKRSGTEDFVLIPYKSERYSNVITADVVCIKEDKQGNIWIGTYTNGLNRFNAKDGSFTCFDTNDGLPGNNIFGILIDKKNNFWLSTNNGIVCFNPKTGPVRSYNHLDGLVDNEFVQGAALQLSDGSFAFGSYGGFTIFHPDSMRVNEFAPPAVFTGLKLFNKYVRPDSGNIINKDISLLDELTLKYDQNVFSVEFGVLNYVHSNRNRYAYMLKGFDTEWNYVDVPTATYTNLAAGTYELYIKGTNNDGIWSEKPSVLIIRVLPAPWRTWWAYLIYVIILTVIAYFIIRFFRDRSRLKQKLLLEQVAFEQEKRVHEEKLFFFSSVSHEIRTPLSLITGPIEKLKSDRHLTQRSKNLLDVSAKNVNRLMTLVDQLLLFQQAENEQIKLNLEKVNLSEFLNEVSEKFAELANEKQITISIEQDFSGDMFVMIDTEKMEKVVTNLLSNSFKFIANEGLIFIKFGFLKETKGSTTRQSHYYFSVSDTGKGIAEEDKAKIFDKFYQSSQKDHLTKGFGIGLALVKSLVDLHEGQIAVESGIAQQKDDVNTTFTVSLPWDSFVMEVVRSEQTPHLSQKMTLKTSQLPATKKIDRDSRPLVLIAEDNIELQHFIKESLETSFNIAEASNGVEAWKKIEDNQPDIVITDMIMPEMGGLELLSNIKTNKNTDHIPVLLLTARTASVDEMEAFQHGVDDYITKPFRVNILIFKINNILKTRKNLEEKFVENYLIKPKYEGHENDDSNSFLSKIVDIVEQNLAREDFSVEDLAKEASLSRTTLYRKVKQLSGVNLIEFISIIRLKKAADVLSSTTNLSISEVAYKVGFSDPKYFSKSFKKFFNQSPSDYQKNQISNRP